MFTTPTNFPFLHFFPKERQIRRTVPDLYHGAVSNHDCYNLIPAMGKCFWCDLIIENLASRRKLFEYLLYRIKSERENDIKWRKYNALTFEANLFRFVASPPVEINLKYPEEKWNVSHVLSRAFLFDRKLEADFNIFFFFLWKAPWRMIKVDLCLLINLITT